MVQEKLNEKLEKRIKHLIQVYDILDKVMNGELKSLDSPEQFSFMKILVSDVGIAFQNHINEILQFWIKILAPQFSNHLIFEQMKFGLASLLGEEIYLKLANFFSQLSRAEITSNKDTKNQDKINLNPQLSIGPEEYNTIGSMTIMSISGYIEDYLNQLKVLIFEQLIIQGNNEEAINFIEKFSRSYLTNRINILLEGMKIQDIVSQCLRKNSNTNYRAQFDEFRKIRNKISHTSEEFDFTNLNPDMENFSSFIKKTIVVQSKSTNQISDTQRVIIQNMIEPLLPIVSYLFLLYCKILPYLTFLDHSYFLWMKVCKDSSVLSNTNIP